MPDPSACCVLLVDDEPDIRDVLSSELKDAGFETLEAQDGIDALVKLRGTLPHVIISDLQMPRMSGIELIVVVRRRFPNIPVIIFSGSSQGELPVEAKPDGWFEKGALQIPELLQAVRDLVRTTPDRPYAPQVISTPVRTCRGGAGYFLLTCTDCLRIFQVMSTPEIKTVERTATCVYCEARIPFLVESADPE
jgi:CheY-like chemotaxis protein